VCVRWMPVGVLAFVMRRTWDIVDVTRLLTGSIQRRSVQTCARAGECGRTETYVGACFVHRRLDWLQGELVAMLTKVIMCLGAPWRLVMRESE
jgi:hypothetical protein